MTANGRTVTGELVRVDLGIFAKATAGLISGLLLASIIALVVLSHKVTILTVKMEAVEKFIEMNTDDMVRARANVTALEILLSRFSDNHTILRRDVDDLREDLEAVIERRRGGTPNG